MQGRTALVTGATSGIGLATAHELARRGAEVILVGRDRARGDAARESVARAATGPAPSLLLADLSSQAEIRALAASVPRLDVLVNNAGGVFTRRALTVDGIERTFALNHLAPFLLTQLLLDRLKAAPQGRIVTVSSRVHARGVIDFDDLQNEGRYGALRAYARSKLANVLFTYALAERLKGTSVTANCLAPGLVATRFGQNNAGFVSWASRTLLPLLARTPEKGAETVIHLAAAPEVGDVTGRYFFDCAATSSFSASRDRAAQERLWRASEELTGLLRTA